MTNRVAIGWSFGAALAAAGNAWANSAPVVSNVTASQRNDGSKKVDIRYNLADADGDACTVSVVVSSDGGNTWTVQPASLSGAVGAGVTPGTGRLIVWDCKLDLPGVFGSQYKARVCADDGHTPIPPGMVLIPAGNFQMGDTFNEGSSGELPIHTVYTDAFYMDRYEVTNADYAAALNWAKAQDNLITVTSGVVYKYNSGTSYPYCHTTTSAGPYSQITHNSTTGQFGVTPGNENHPMVCVSWYGAAAYANWRSGMQGRPLCYNLSTWACNFNVAGYRLPTEAEWEKAARGGAAGHRFPWSDVDTITHRRANYYSSTIYPYDTSDTIGFHPLWGLGDDPRTSPVGFFNGSLRYKADFNWPGSPTSYQTVDGVNGYGLYDMAGNVWEWCNDWYSSTYYGSSPSNNPTGPTSGTYRVLRGGSWYYYARFTRCASRIILTLPDYRVSDIGLRLALDSP